MLESVENIKNSHDKIDKMINKNDYKVKGYGARCKVCNHAKRDDIEELRELGYSFNKIIQELNLKGDVSEMALSRHFKNHYPESKKYKEKLELLKEKEILKAIEDYPAIKPYFMEDYNDFTETFFNNYGFCVTTQGLCNIVPEKTILYPEEVLEKLEDKYNNVEKHNIKTKLNYLEHIIRCQNCQLRNMQSNNNVLIVIILNKLVDKDFDHEKELIPLIIDKEYNKKVLSKEFEKKT